MTATMEADVKTAQEKNAEYNEAVADRERRQSIMAKHAESATIYKVGYVSGTVAIEYSIIENNKNNDFTLSSDDAPCDAFRKALHSLGPYVSHLINKDEAERQWQGMKMTAMRVSFKYHDNGNTHASIAVSRELDSGHCFTFNTPFMPIETDDAAVASLAKDVGKGMADALYALISEAKAYIGGKRSQGTLDFPEGQAADDEDDEYGEEGEEDGDQGEEEE